MCLPLWLSHAAERDAKEDMAIELSPDYGHKTVTAVVGERHQVLVVERVSVKELVQAMVSVGRAL